LANPQRQTGPILQCVLDVQILFHDPLSGGVGALSGGLADGFDKVAVVAAERDLCADAQQRGHGDALQQRPSVIIDFILQAGVTGWIGGRHIVDFDVRAVGKDDPLPDHERPALAEGHHAVVVPE